MKVALMCLGVSLTRQSSSKLSTFLALLHYDLTTHVYEFSILVWKVPLSLSLSQIHTKKSTHYSNRKFRPLYIFSLDIIISAHKIAQKSDMYLQFFCMSLYLKKGLHNPVT